MQKKKIITNMHQSNCDARFYSLDSIKRKHRDCSLVLGWKLHKMKSNRNEEEKSNYRMQCFATYLAISSIEMMKICELKRKSKIEILKSAFQFVYASELIKLFNEWRHLFSSTFFVRKFRHTHTLVLVKLESATKTHTHTFPQLHIFLVRINFNGANVLWLRRTDIFWEGWCSTAEWKRRSEKSCDEEMKKSPVLVSNSQRIKLVANTHIPTDSVHSPEYIIDVPSFSPFLFFPT